MEQSLKTQIKRLRKNLRNMRKLNNANLHESVERGIALEKIKKLVESCKNQISDELYERLNEPIQEYVIRCTDVRKKARNKI